MPRALSTHLFVNRRLTPEVLARVEQAGIPQLELFCAKQHFDYTDPAQVREIAGWFKEHSLQLRSLHSPLYRDYEWGRSGGGEAAVNLAAVERLRRLQSVDEVKRCLEVAEHVPFRYLVQHLGVPREEFALEKFDAAYASLEALQLFARQRGVKILLENIPNELSTPARLLQFFDYTRLKLEVCFDTGHAHLAGGVPADFEPLRPLVRSTHVHDNRGEQDDHLFPFQGTINWPAAMRALAAAGDDVPLQLELRDYGEFADPLDKARETFDRLEELLASEAEGAAQEKK